MKLQIVLMQNTLDSTPKQRNGLLLTEVQMVQIKTSNIIN